jgi:nucleotide-binding universal stress UspA family protein
MRILIAYDGSPCADVAIEDLARAGLPENAEARVVSAADVFIRPPADPRAVESSPLEGFPDVQAARELARQARDRADQNAARAAARAKAMFPGWDVSHESYPDSPAWGIVHGIEKFKADLAVVGSHSRGVLGRLVLGSVSQKVLSYAKCSVRIARCRESGMTKSPVKLLVGIDGSPDSAVAISAVASRYWPAGSEARVVLVRDLRMVTALLALGAASATGPVPEVFPASRRWIDEALKNSAKELTDAGLSVTTDAPEGDPKAVLVEEAERWKPDSIFLGAKGLSRVERFLLGSVSAAVAARAQCTVEVVRLG